MNSNTTNISINDSEISKDLKSYDENNESLVGLDEEDQLLLKSIMGQSREYKKMPNNKWLKISRITLISMITLFALNILFFGLMLFYSMFVLTIKMNMSISAWRDFYLFGIFSPVSILSMIITLSNLGISIFFNIFCMKYDYGSDEKLDIIVDKLSILNRWNILLFIPLISLYVLILAGFYGALFGYGVPLIIVSTILILVVFGARFMYMILMGTYLLKKSKGN